MSEKPQLLRWKRKMDKETVSAVRICFMLWPLTVSIRTAGSDTSCARDTLEVKRSPLVCTNSSIRGTDAAEELSFNLTFGADQLSFFHNPDITLWQTVLGFGVCAYVCTCCFFELTKIIRLYRLTYVGSWGLRAVHSVCITTSKYKKHKRWKRQCFLFLKALLQKSLHH